MTFEDLERAWVELNEAWGQRMIAEHQGRPIDDDHYAGLRRAFDVALRDFPTAALSDEERAGLATMRSAIAGLDEYVPVDGVAMSEAAAYDSATQAEARRFLEDYGAAAEAIDVGGERIDRLTAFERLATSDDATERRATFEAMEPVWRAIDGDGGRDSPYRRLIKASAQRWDAMGSVVDTNAAVLGIAQGALEPILTTTLDAGRRLLASVTDGRPIEPWDYRYLVGEADRRLRAALPPARLREINDRHLTDLGADPQVLGISYDIEPRPGRPPIPVAFTMGVGIPARPWVFATYATGGLGSLAELIHESGHALHYAAIRTRPSFAEPPMDHAAWFEAVADILGWDATEPAFLVRHTGQAVDPRAARLSRHGSVLLDVCWALFEIELHRSPDRRPNDVWTEITRDGLGIVGHPEWSWWAVRGQLIDAPGYLANYALSAIAAAAVRARLRELRGDWSSGDPGWYPFLAETLLRFGGARSPAELLAAFLGRLLTGDALLADLEPGPH
jgi:hypothetical protein